MNENLIAELMILSESNLYSIDKIEWWLLKHKNHYDYCCNNWNNNSTYGDLPDIITLNSEESKFKSFYSSFVEICEFHRYESFAKFELEFYLGIEENEYKVKEWLMKNEKFGSETLACFLTDYLDYDSDNSKCINLNVYQRDYPQLNFFVKRSDFENLLKFKLLFDSLYYK